MKPETHYTRTGLPKLGALFSRRDLRRGPAVVKVVQSRAPLFKVENVANKKRSEVWAEYFDRRYAPYVETPTAEDTSKA